MAARGRGEGELRRNRRGYLILDQRTEAWCRERYAAWLEAKGVRQFGEPLDHGDELGAAGFEADRQQDPTPVAADSAGDGDESAEAQAPASIDQTAAPDSAPDRKTVTGRLRAVSDGTPGPAPASALDRRKIEHWRSTRGYKPETVEALAALFCGERILERLSHEQVHRLALTLEIAVRGKVGERDLAASLTRLGGREDREAAAQQLRERLVAKANEAELAPGSRRRAA